MATLPVILINGTTADANQVMADFNEIYTNIDSTNVAAGNKTGTGKFVLQTSPAITSPTFTGPNTFNGNSTFDTSTLFVDSVNHRVYVGSISSAFAGIFQVIQSLAGGNLASCVHNLDNTNSASNAILCAEVAGASGGDPYALFTLTGIVSWALGIDNSDSDRFKISNSSSLGTSDKFILDSGGNGYFDGSTTTKTQFISQATTGTAPIVTPSTTVCTNLNADLLDGLDSTAFPQLSVNEVVTGHWTFPSQNPPTANTITQQSIAKAFGAFDTTGAGGVFAGSYNIDTTSSNKIATGIYDVYVSTVFSSGNWFPQATSITGSLVATASVISATHARVTLTKSDTNVTTDGFFNFVAFGVQ